MALDKLKMTELDSPKTITVETISLAKPVESEADSPNAESDGTNGNDDSVKSITDSLDCHLTRILEETYGSRLERMFKYSKLSFRAILSLYIFWSHWWAAEQPEEMMAEAIEQIDSDLHLDDEDVYNAIAACVELPTQDLEQIMQALSQQIQQECWSTERIGVPGL
ncbi:hypothetical protein IQ249_21140 [Lusitaniella coriacea LEGE 07157]|uniref:Uncharacterized protein n=2 Tax=Lusitaniella TaxID=1983104 RepID=A0A8J7DZD5_9CYAN|nr:hypothetical protein [Lusitaniella coriacea LEGE 07157]